MTAIFKEAEYLGENPSALPKSFDVEGITDGLIRRRLSLETNESLCLSLYLNGIIQVARTVCGELNRDDKRLKFCATPAKGTISVGLAKINVIN